MDDAKKSLIKVPILNGDATGSEVLDEAGVDAFVAGSFVFKSDNPSDTISNLKNLVQPS